MSMQEHLTVVLRLAVGWFLFSFALWKMFGKLGRLKRWLAWIPGLRYVALGDVADMDKEGWFCGIMDLFILLSTLLEPLATEGRLSVALSLVLLILYVFLFVYRIQLVLRLIELFGLSKWWILPWLLIEWLPPLIWGMGKKYQPQREIELHDAWKAGTAPAAIATASHAAIPSYPGLSVELRERTVKDFGKKRYLLKDIDLEIPNGSLVLLLGGSGAGKTTLVNAVIGYEKADATILLNGSNVYEDYDSVKYRIGFVPQKNLVRGNDTVIRTISDAAELRMPAATSGRERRQRVTEVMDHLGLTAGSGGLVSKKSGGQLRRISIAMELVTDPELFVLDEPDSGLDGVMARELFARLREIADEGKIVIAITHTPDRVIDLFDKVIVLAKDSGRVGRLVFYGSPAETRSFFGRDTMEGVVMCVNRKEEGGEGRADEFIERYARLCAAEEAVS